MASTPLRRGRLQIYLGFAPGGGKTFAMLREGRDRRDDGEDVVIGFVEPHDRPRTQEAIGNLEVIPRLRLDYRGTVLEEMDLDAVLARSPQVALVDELAHTNAPGLRHDKRWRDIEALRDVGVDVITTVNVQHLESVKDLVEAITGITVRETVPDQLMDRADEIQFIDITPEALRKRMRHGNIYPRERIETALSNFFREGNLVALREIALRMVADRLGSRGNVRGQPEDVLVAISGGPSSEMLIRRAVRLARRVGGFCAAVHVHHAPARTGEWRELATRLQCPIVERDGDITAEIIDVARERGTCHVVVGEHAPLGTLARLTGTTVVDGLVERLTDVDLHVVARFSPLRGGKQQKGRPPPEDLLASIPTASRQGELRLYLGYARGCGTTTAMLHEAERRRSRGTDVIVARLATPERQSCVALASNLPWLRGEAGRRGELDVAALLTRNPDVACIDDLVGGTTDGRRIVEALPDILGAGIVAIATAHLADLRSVRDGIGAHLSSAGDAPLIDDTVLDLADEIELIDIPPSELVERLRDGEILPPADAARALQSDFRPETLAALREIAFRRLAAHTDRRLIRYMQRERISTPWEARPRLLVCVPPRPGMELVIERAAATATRRDEDLVALTVRRGRRGDEERHLLGRYAALTHRRGGAFVTLDGSDIAETIALYARERLITEVVAVRGPGRGRAGTLRRLVRLLTDTDLHILAEAPSD